MTTILLATLLLAQDASEYFPLKPGMKWTYKSGDGAEVVKTVRETDAKGVLAVSNFGSWGVFRKEALLRVGKEAVELSKLSKSTVDMIWLKTPLKAGEKWQSKAKLGDVGVDFESVVEGEEEIAVPAGKYPCIRVKTTFKDAEGTFGQILSWYAKGVGEVRSTIGVTSGSKKSEIVRDLVKFEAEAGK